MIGHGSNQLIINGQGPNSSRHFGTHELQPNLIAQQENKFATVTSVNGLVVYQSHSSKPSEYKDDSEKYFSNNTNSNIDSRRLPNPLLYTSINQQRQTSRDKEKQLFIIRESCPSPLGEDELIDDFGCPFDHPSA